MLAWEEAERAGAAFVDRTAAVVRAAIDPCASSAGGDGTGRSTAQLYHTLGILTPRPNVVGCVLHTVI